MRQQLETACLGWERTAPSLSPARDPGEGLWEQQERPAPAHLMLGDVDEKLLLQELLQDVFGSHVNQGLQGKGQRWLGQPWHPGSHRHSQAGNEHMDLLELGNIPFFPSPTS